MAARLVGDILPITADEVVVTLEQEPGSSAYLICGEKQGRAWRLARQLIGPGGIAKLLLYRVLDRAEIIRWTDGKRPAGVVLGFKARASALVDGATSENLVQLVTLIAKVQAEPQP